jgi:hypothetical protein
MWSENNMDILNSGSFVPLDNKERMEQLAFTAKTLAIEVSRAEGFQSSGPANHQLALEMWKGAEYVCRAHEEANIKNIFLGKFLATLRDIEKQKIVEPTPTATPIVGRPPDLAPPQVQPITVATASVPVPLSESSPTSERSPWTETADEYLGVVPDRDEIKPKRPSYADECVPEGDAGIEAIVDRLDDEHTELETDTTPVVLTSEPTAPAIPPSESSSATQSDSTTNSDQACPNSSNRSVEVGIEDERVDALDGATSIESIVIADKEPYNLDTCTITAVIQVLPESDAMRKCIVSIRTHDFAPMVAVGESVTLEVIPHISNVLSELLERYRNDLPTRAAEKLKNEKPAAKRQSKSASKVANKAMTPPTSVATTSSASPVQSAPTGQSQQGLFGA